MQKLKLYALINSCDPKITGNVSAQVYCNDYTMAYSRFQFENENMLSPTTPVFPPLILEKKAKVTDLLSSYSDNLLFVSNKLKKLLQTCRLPTDDKYSFNKIKVLQNTTILDYNLFFTVNFTNYIDYDKSCFEVSRWVMGEKIVAIEKVLFKDTEAIKAFSKNELPPLFKIVPINLTFTKDISFIPDIFILDLPIFVTVISEELKNRILESKIIGIEIKPLPFDIDL